MLAKITAKNQLTLPKSVTEPLGPVQYFDVQTRGGQIVLTPVRIQRGDALRAKLAELALSQKTLDAALAWAETQLGGVKTIETPKKAGSAKTAKPSSALAARKSGGRPLAEKTLSQKTAAKKAGARKTGPRKNAADVSAKTIETPPSRKKATTVRTAKPSSAAAKSVSTTGVARKSAAKPLSSPVKRSQAVAAASVTRGRTARGTTTSRRAA